MTSTQLGTYFTLALFSLKSPVSLFPSCLTFSLFNFLKMKRKPSRMGAGGVYTLLAISVKNNFSVTQSLSQAPAYVGCQDLTNVCVHPSHVKLSPG